MLALLTSRSVQSNSQERRCVLKKVGYSPKSRNVIPSLIVLLGVLVVLTALFSQLANSTSYSSQASSLSSSFFETDTALTVRVDGGIERPGTTAIFRVSVNESVEKEIVTLIVLDPVEVLTFVLDSGWEYKQYHVAPGSAETLTYTVDNVIYQLDGILAVREGLISVNAKDVKTGKHFMKTFELTLPAEVVQPNV